MESPLSPSLSETTAVDDELEWEEWDGSIPFWTHCLAGGIAGIAEHTLLYPIDTVKTHMQSYCATCPHQAAPRPSTSSSSLISSHLRPAAVVGNPIVSSTSSPLGMWSTLSHLVYPDAATAGAAAAPAPPNYSFSQRIQHTTASVGHTTSSTSGTPSLARLFRGIQTMVVGCAPAHALYFSSYEVIKQLFTSRNNDSKYLSTIGSMSAGATATFFHDCIMTPLDTMKQRLQLGHYDGSMSTAFRSIIQTEGIPGLYRSLGITLGSNVPYGMLTITMNEKFRAILSENTSLKPTEMFMVAGCGAGCIASAVTTPLDRIKTRLQVQSMGANVDTMCKATAHCPVAAAAAQQAKYHGFWDAYSSIVKEEGYRGLWRGTVPRVLSQTPAVAISWTAYETVKTWLLSD
mmetsp:Transcript_21897/g.31426  ORF Transcript_21897/g.31426 Transcript_21897/m.31426 type:complete len:403 (-) Transcript_21897:295-1503(-)|eukprot:CAMPEP_0172417104 /NCGR_PEP_ID=MMETSP1064-20121228/3607_1 /TAXON_ID=202472 /ORGANISM="Aulacoseira subarctica , Strain CCAP 1002/5" /LENGTH=402 /DNA_ID=CAMNT_0013155207 /DNA_START=190 /DNA_END=1398 /DNA_ORIENTATION=-